MKIKFITLNLWWGGNLFDGIIKFLTKEKPDIFVLQEVYDGKDPRFPQKYRSIEVLKKELNYPYYSFSPCLLDIKKGGKIEQGNAIFSKYPIKSVKTVFYDVSYGERQERGVEDWLFTPRNLQQAVIDVKDTFVNVFNTQGIWGLDGGDNERRLKMSETIINEIKDKKNVILAGDFNLRPNTKTIQNIEKYLINIFKNGLKTTFNMKRKDDEGFKEAVVDMIFVSNNIKVLDRNCPQVDISDHLPLICTLEID